MPETEGEPMTHKLVFPLSYSVFLFLEILNIPYDNRMHRQGQKIGTNDDKY